MNTETDNNVSSVAESAARIAARPSDAPDQAPRVEEGERPAGHCNDDAAWSEFVRQYAGQGRTLPALTDFELANAIYMASRTDLDLIVYQTAAKERIRWLSIRLAQAEAALAAPQASRPLVSVEEVAREKLFLQAHDALEAAREIMRGPVFSSDVAVYEQVNSALYAIRSRPAITASPTALTPTNGEG